MKKITCIVILLVYSFPCFAQDTQAPTTPTNFQFLTDNPLSSLTPESFYVEWEHATDNVGVASYEIYINGILDEIVPYDGSNPVQIQYFSNFPNGTYCLTMLARDAAGNASPLTGQICRNIYVIYQTEPNKLYISGMLNHAGDDKAIELSNLTYQNLDLSDFTLKISYNGSGTWDDVYTFPANAVVSTGDTFIIAHPNISICSNLVDDYNSTITNFDGNDVIGLFKYDVYYDTLGELGNAGSIVNNNVFMKRTFMTSIIPTTIFDGDQWSTDGDDGTCPDLMGFAESLAILSTNEVATNNFQIYPNPVQGNFIYIQTKNNIEISAIQLFDMTGKEIIRQVNPSNQINVQGLQQGVYILQLKSNNQTVTKKLIIE
ncbi:T9SS type A sorting domain-containing protein [Kordia jejudonensis]|uniref:T9SS type A sorting domain-containing protein n=1 Tax=Kordia jejudonensis TaxID=1348245 RepID=UPI0006294718|nr:T9SS type A sorting domain-containing protein [Kordia jejudonensis]